MQTVAGRNVCVRAHRLLDEQHYSSQIKQGKLLVGIVFNENIQIATVLPDRYHADSDP